MFDSRTLQEKFEPDSKTFHHPTVEAQDIRDFRKHKGLSQEALGQLCGVKKSTVSEWESGKSRPSGSAAILLGDYLSGKRCLVPLTSKEERLLDEAVQRGGFNGREDFLAACLMHLIRHGGIDNVPPLPPEKARDLPRAP